MVQLLSARIRSHIAAAVDSAGSVGGALDDASLTVCLAALRALIQCTLLPESWRGSQTTGLRSRGPDSAALGRDVINSAGEILTACRNGLVVIRSLKGSEASAHTCRVLTIMNVVLTAVPVSLAPTHVRGELAASDREAQEHAQRQAQRLVGIENSKDAVSLLELVAICGPAVNALGVPSVTIDGKCNDDGAKGSESTADTRAAAPSASWSGAADRTAGSTLYSFDDARERNRIKSYHIEQQWLVIGAVLSRFPQAAGQAAIHLLAEAIANQRPARGGRNASSDDDGDSLKSAGLLPLLQCASMVLPSRLAVSQSGAEARDKTCALRDTGASVEGEEVNVDDAKGRARLEMFTTLAESAWQAWLESARLTPATADAVARLLFQPATMADAELIRMRPASELQSRHLMPWVLPNDEPTVEPVLVCYFRRMRLLGEGRRPHILRALVAR